MAGTMNQEQIIAHAVKLIKQVLGDDPALCDFMDDYIMNNYEVNPQGPMTETQENLANFVITDMYHRILAQAILEV